MTYSRCKQTPYQNMINIPNQEWQVSQPNVSILLVSGLIIANYICEYSQ